MFVLWSIMIAIVVVRRSLRFITANIFLNNFFNFLNDRGSFFFTNVIFLSARKCII